LLKIYRGFFESFLWVGVLSYLITALQITFGTLEINSINFSILCISGTLTPISAVAESAGFLCDTERQRITQKNGAFGNQLDVLVMCMV
jgi:hypothetical protein